MHQKKKKKCISRLWVKTAWRSNRIHRLGINTVWGSEITLEFRGHFGNHFCFFREGWGLTPNHLVSTLKVLGSTPKIKSQHLNLEVDTESFGVYPESFRFNTKNWQSIFKLESWHRIIWCLKVWESTLKF